jgi:CubicO group peptidase (beta-lactamase class C family)
MFAHLIVGVLGLVAAPAQASPGPSPAPVVAPSREACERAADYSTKFAGRVVVVMVNGEVVFERADNGWSLDRPHPLASGTKSFSGVVAAAAVQDGLLAWDELAADTLTEWKDDPRKSRIAVRQLLSLSSGLDPGEETLGSVNPRGSALGEGAVTRAQRIRERLGEKAKPVATDKFAAAVELPALDEPGAVFRYGPGNFYAFGELLERKLRASGRAEKGFIAYADARVFGPVGMAPLRWGRDRAGKPNLPGGTRLTGREWAKFGEFVRLGGAVRRPDGTLEQVVSREALAECFLPSAANPSYGLTWWLLGDGGAGAGAADGVAVGRARRQREQTGAVKGPDGKPLTVYMAAGLGKQRLFILPQYNMVVVRFAEATREGAGFDNGEFLGPLLGVEHRP